MKTTSLIAALAAACAGSVAVGVALASHNQRGADFLAWEYAELTIRGDDGVLVTATGVWSLEGPDRRTPEKAENDPKISVVRPASLIHLNDLGAAGWDVVQGGSADANQFLLRRPR